MRSEFQRVRETPSEGSDYFSLFGLPPHPDIDITDLESRYYVLTKEYHPDLHQKETRGEQNDSLRITARITKAYRTLKDPVERGRYWLDLKGEKLSRDNAHVPADVADEVFDVFDALQTWKSLPSQEKSHLYDFLHASKLKFDSKVNEDIERLKENFSQWPRSGQASSDTNLLAQLKVILSRISYLSSLARDIEKTMGIPFPSPRRREGK